MRRSGPLLLVFSSLLFGVMVLLAKQAATLVPGPEVAFVRFIVGVVGAGFYAFTIRPLRPVNWAGLLLRGFFGGMAVLGFFITIWKLPVGLATLLNYTAPVATALLAALFLGERVSLATVGALVITTIGVVLVVHAHAPVGELGFGPWQLVGLGSAICSGAAVTAIRWARRTDGAWEIFASFCLIGAVVCAPVAIRMWVRPTPLAWTLMILVGVISIVAQILFIYALRFTRAAVAGVISQLTPISAMIAGAALLSEPATPMAFVGAAVTLGGVVWGAYQGREDTRPSS